MATKKETLEIAVDVTGDKEAIGSIKQLEAASAKMAATAEKNAARVARGQGAVAKVQNLVTKETKNAGREMGGLVNVGAELAYSFGTAIPPMRGVATQAAMMGGSAYQLGAAFGPVGVAIGVVVGLLPTFITLMNEATGETVEQAEALEKSTTSLEQYAAALLDSRRRQSVARRIAGGMETVEEARGVLGRANEEIRRHSEMLGQAAHSAGVSEAAYADLTHAYGLSNAAIADLVRNNAANLQIENTGEASIRRLIRATQDYVAAIGKRGEAQARLNALESEGVAADVDEFEGQVDSDRIDRMEAKRRRNEAFRRRRRSGGRRRRRTERIDFGSVDLTANNEGPTEPDSDYSGELMEMATRTGRNQQSLQQVLRGMAQEAEAARREAVEEEDEYLKNSLDRLSGYVDERNELVNAAETASETFAGSWRSGIDSVIEAFGDYNEAAEAAGRTSLSTAELVAKSARAIGNEMADSIGEIATSALRTHVDAWLSGEESIGEAAKGIARDIIRELAAESIVKSIYYGAEAVVAAVTPGRQGQAAGYAAGAAMYAGLAGVAGGLGYAAGAFGGGGSADTTRPELPSGIEDENRASGNTFVINVGSFAVGTKADVGREILGALGEVERIDGMRI